MGLLDAFEHDGGDVEQLLFLAQTWRDQEAMKREIAHAPDCAVAMNARHDCSCGQNPANLARESASVDQHSVVQPLNRESK